MTGPSKTLPTFRTLLGLPDRSESDESDGKCPYCKSGMRSATLDSVEALRSIVARFFAVSDTLKPHGLTIREYHESTGPNKFVVVDSSHPAQVVLAEHGLWQFVELAEIFCRGVARVERATTRDAHTSPAETAPD